jgi:hypothetical protein
MPVSEKRKRPVWTKAMRKAAAEAGARGNREAKAAGGRRGGLIAWGTRTEEEREAIREMLRNSRQRNRSKKARAAQGRRGAAVWAAHVAGKPMSAAKAAWLAEAGMLKCGGRVMPPARTGPDGVSSAVQQGVGLEPTRADYPMGAAGAREWAAAVWAWRGKA